ncbi:MAG: Smr/MutS family protein [Oligoflexia bacterium]|nr:Smr/MutS family protein [Oligoflexia bacterium]
MSFHTIPSLDLHGKQEDEIFDLLDRFIREHKDKEQVLLIVGKGRGIVKGKAIEYLKLTHYSWSYEKVRGIVNPGALLVDLH